MPATATVAVIGAMGIAGLPGIAAFISEFMIFAGVYKISLANKLLFTVVAILGTALSAAYMTVFIRKIFFGKLPERLSNVHDAPVAMLAPMVGLAILAIIIGIYPGPILNPILSGLNNYFKFFTGV